MQCVTWRLDDAGKTPEASAIPPSFEEAAQARRTELLETLAEHDDTLLERYLAGDPLDGETIRGAVRKSTLSGALVPVLLGSGLHNKGIQPLLDAILWYLPSPADVPSVAGVEPVEESDIERHNDPNEPLAALAFKIALDQGRRLTYLRLYAGCLEAGTQIYNPRTGETERVARLLRMHANKRQRLDRAQAGDIVAATGLKDAATGDTLCDPAHPIRFEAIACPEPVINLAVEPMTNAEQDKLQFALDKLAAEDPTLRVQFDEERGHTILSGMGELHLEVLIRRLADEFQLKVSVGNPQVVYRETIEGRRNAQKPSTRGCPQEKVPDVTWPSLRPLAGGPLRLPALCRNTPSRPQT